jgi:NAD(P)-dependent dehydrogenase (short-subunit alcohol dehydrogenase family)
MKGIGMGLAIELARQGTAVAVGDIHLHNARKVANEVSAARGRTVALYCDVCERDSIQEMKAQANKAFGPLRLLFANARATSFTPLMAMPDNDVDWIIQVNLMGVVVNTTRAFLPDVMLAREGPIVATASIAGLLPGWIPVHVPYSATKMGIIGFVSTWKERGVIREGSQSHLRTAAVARLYLQSHYTTKFRGYYRIGSGWQGVLATGNPGTYGEPRCSWKRLALKPVEFTRDAGALHDEQPDQSGDRDQDGTVAQDHWRDAPVHCAKARRGATP